MAANEMKLAPGFELFEASHDEVPALFQVMEDAFGTEDELWKIIFADVEVKEVQPWLMEHLALRWKLPDIKCFKIVDQSNRLVLLYADTLCAKHATAISLVGLRCNTLGNTFLR